MKHTHIARGFCLSLMLMLATAGLSLTGTATATDTDTDASDQTSSELLPDFEADDGLESEEEGFDTIYVDREGNLLGTFVNVPGAKIKVYASGQIEFEARDYTTEVDYDSNGRIRAIGRTRLSYYPSGRIRSIANIDFRYSKSGRVRSIGDTDFDYARSGRISEIEDVEFEYDRDGILESIDASQTRDGIRIVVVN